MIYCTALQLLGRHVTHCSHHNAGICIYATSWDVCLLLIAIGLSEFCEPEVENLHSSIISDEDVVGFQIAVNDSLLVCCGEAICKLQRIIKRASLGQWRTSDPLAQRLAFQQFGNDVGRPIVHVDVVNYENVWVIECARGTSLLLKSA